MAAMILGKFTNIREKSQMGKFPQLFGTNTFQNVFEASYIKSFGKK